MHVERTVPKKDIASWRAVMRMSSKEAVVIEMEETKSLMITVMLMMGIVLQRNPAVYASTSISISESVLYFLSLIH